MNLYVISKTDFHKNINGACIKKSSNETFPKKSKKEKEKILLFFIVISIFAKQEK